MPAQIIAARRSAPRSRRAREIFATESGRTPSTFVMWYLGLIPHWTSATPRLKGRILLRTHEWILDRVLAPGRDLDAAVADLRPDGPLTQTLTELVPVADAAEWHHFIQVVVANLRHAMLLPVAHHNEAWVRWLFLIPYSIRETPAPDEAPVAAAAR